MLTIYCPNTQCAEANHYTLTKPAKCQYCGTPFSALVPNNEAVIAKQKLTDDQENLKQLRQHKPQKQKIQKQREEQEASEFAEIPQIQGLEYEIAARPKFMTFGELANQKKTGFKGRPAERKQSKQEFLEEFKKEASSNRTPIEIQDVE